MSRPEGASRTRPGCPEPTATHPTALPAQPPCASCRAPLVVPGSLALTPPRSAAGPETYLAAARTQRAPRRGGPDDQQLGGRDQREQRPRGNHAARHRRLCNRHIGRQAHRAARPQQRPRQEPAPAAAGTTRSRRSAPAYRRTDRPSPDPPVGLPGLRGPPRANSPVSKHWPFGAVPTRTLSSPGQRHRTNSDRALGSTNKLLRATGAVGFTVAGIWP